MDSTGVAKIARRLPVKVFASQMQDLSPMYSLVRLRLLWTSIVKVYYEADYLLTRTVS